MRCPSEVLTLRWSDIDFEKGRIRIDSSKTGLRFCPLFPEVREVLLEAKEEAEGRDALVARRFRGRLNLRTHFQRIVTRGGLKPWPKLFHNLRSSCRTELQERFPSHAIDA
jgi:integrase